MARTKAITYTETTVAVINSTEYTTLQLAIDNVADNETVQLIKSISESITIPVTKNFTLNIGTNTLTNTEGQHTINNKGIVTITGEGTIDNISNEKAALWNDGTAVLTGNTYTRSQENGQSSSDSGGNSYYTVVNHGIMTINDGTTVTQNGKYSSLLENGWYNGSENTSGSESVLTIEGGTFTGGLNTIKNDDYGKLTINNGSFTNMAQSALLNWNDATITNGTFTADETSQSVVINGYLTTKTNMDKGSLNIQGGTYSVGTPEAKSAGVTALSLMGQTEHCGTISISGGTLNGDIKTDAGTEKGGSLTISGTARIEGQIQNSKSDVVNVNGGTVTQGIVNNGPGTINVTDGTVQGGIQNASNGFTYISGGTIDGGVTQALPNAVTEITGGTFTNYGDTDFSEFVPEDSKFEIGEDGTITVEPEPTKYTVTVTGGTGSGEYEEGVTVTCVATIPEGKEFNVWEVTGITGVVLGNSTLTFAMPANDVTCTAKFKDAEQPQPENGWYFTVTQEGTSLNGLALRFNIPLKKLMADNNITEYRPLYEGEQILIIDDGKEKAVNSTTCWIP